MCLLSVEEGILNHEEEKLTTTGRKNGGEHVTEGQYSPPGRKG